MSMTVIVFVSRWMMKSRCTSAVCYIQKQARSTSPGGVDRPTNNRCKIEWLGDIWRVAREAGEPRPSYHSPDLRDIESVNGRFEGAIAQLCSEVTCLGVRRSNATRLVPRMVSRLRGLASGAASARRCFNSNRRPYGSPLAQNWVAKLRSRCSPAQRLNFPQGHRSRANPGHSFASGRLRLC